MNFEWSINLKKILGMIIIILYQNQLHYSSSN